MEILKIPTAVPAFDSIIKGGMPSGSVVLLLGEPGSGHYEFAITSATKTSLAREAPDRRKLILSEIDESTYLPNNVLYISTTKSEREIRRNITLSIDEDMQNYILKNLKVKDLSKIYFKKTVVPSNWIKSASIFDYSEKDIIEEIINILGSNGEDSIIIIDSLTDLLTNININVQTLIDMLKGLVRVSKNWKSIIYLILTEGIVDQRIEREIMDIVDGVLIFRWYSSEKSSSRYTYMFVPKFIGVLPHIEEERVIKFKTRIEYSNGFIVTYTEKIR
ncbi:MAG: RAD55 family ATPase [Thermoplasmata archaeon]